MIAIREIVTRDIFKNFEIPEEFGDEFEMILLPIRDTKTHHLAGNYNDSKSINSLDKWEKFGYWDPDAENMNLCSSGMLKRLDDELGSEDYTQWQK